MNDVLHSISVISTGLFAGLMMTLVFLLQRQWARQNQQEYALYFGQFLLVAKGHPLITFLSIASFALPLYLATQTDGKAMLLYAAAGVLFLIGCFIVTVFLNLPIYRRVIAWKSADDAAGWQEVRKKFLVLNIIRFSSALGSLILLLLAIL